MINQERLKELFYYDPLDGQFVRMCGRYNGDVAGCKTPTGYISIKINLKSYLAHRLAWLYVNGIWPNQIDHISGVKDDNRIANLRSVTSQENMKNSKIRNDNTTGVVGVCWKSRDLMWESRINANGKNKHLGQFKYKWDAICVRKSAERKYEYHENHGRNC